MSQSVLPMFSSKSFTVSGLTFRSLIHFEVIFVYGVRVYSPVFPAPISEETVFSPVYSCLLCHRLGDPKCMGLSLDFLSCFTDLYFCVCASTIVF